MSSSSWASAQIETANCDSCVPGSKVTRHGCDWLRGPSVKAQQKSTWKIARSEHSYGFAAPLPRPECSVALYILSLPFSLSQELEEELKAKTAKLNELRKTRLSDDEEHTETGFISHVNTTSQALTALTEQVHTRHRTLPYNSYYSAAWLNSDWSNSIHYFFTINGFLFTNYYVQLKY